MISGLPNYIPIIFGATTFLTVLLFYWTIIRSQQISTRKKAPLIVIMMVLWLVIQSVFTIMDIYHAHPEAIPPKILLFGVAPPMIGIIILFLSRQGKNFMDSLPPANLAFINVVRIPVELVLWWLFLHGTIPQLMTFEGRNFDIIAGISAPVVAYGIYSKMFNRKTIIAWNILCICLLINIVVHAFFSAPTPFQKFAFGQPNIAILYFPFSWLPSFVVPVVLFSHLALIRKFYYQKN